MDADTNHMLDAARQYWRHADEWAGGALGVSLTQFTIVLTLLLLAWLLRRPASRTALWMTRLLLRHRAQSAVNAIATAVTAPARLIPFVAALFIISELVLSNTGLADVCRALGKSMVVLLLFWALFSAVNPLIAFAESSSKHFSDSMVGLVSNSFRIMVFGIGAATILDIWGIKVGPILAGFGLVGAAVALGAQDLFKNLIGGVFIVAEKRFDIGDWIRVDGVVEGTVEFIGLRTTRIRRFDMAPEFVPNSQLSDNQVTNFQKMTYRQISWLVGLTYDTSADQLARIRQEVDDYIRGSGDFVVSPDAAPLIRIDNFGDSAINMMVYCFTHTTDWEAWLKIKEALMFKIMAIVADAGSGFAFPSQSVYIESMPKGFELFPLPSNASETLANSQATTPQRT